MKITEYILEIYMPGSIDTCWVVFSSPTPFMATSVGDIIDPGLWEGSQSPMKILRTIGLEHYLWEIEGSVKHKICIYTEEIDGSLDARLKRKT
jgi:hypothetical protein